MVNLVKRFSKTGGKLAIVFVSIFIVLNIFIVLMRGNKPITQYDPIKRNREMVYNVINNPDMQKTQEGKITIMVYRSVSCTLIGEGCSNNPEDGNKNYSHSLFGYMGNMISVPIQNPPASGVMWAYNGLQNAGFVPQSYAAEGIGFAALKPVEGMWRIFRDASYLLIVMFFMIVGFMIMFRMKLNPQTVISIENSLPRVVISLLLITFSFAIAGFMIDLMYVLMAVIISLVAGDPGNPYYNVGEFQNKYLSASPGLLINDVLFPYKLTNFDLGGGVSVAKYINILFPLASIPANILDKVWNLVSISSSILTVFPFSIQLFFYIIGGATTSFLVDKVVSDTSWIGKMIDNLGIATINVGGLLAGGKEGITRYVSWLVIGMIALPIVLGIIILFTIVFLFFRIFFMLLNSYLRLLFLIIFSPLFMLYEAIPGRKGFSTWIKNMLAEILTFPLVTLLLVTGYVLVNNAAGSGQGQIQAAGATIGLSKPLWAPPFLYGFNQAAYAFLLGMGIIFIIPQIVKMMREMLGIKKSPISVGVGTFLGSAGVVAGGGMTLLTQFSAITAAVGGPQLAAKIMGRVPGVKQLVGALEGPTDPKQVPVGEQPVTKAH